MCILSFNCPEWFISDVAAIFAGGFACGLYATNSADTDVYVLNDSRADILVVESDSELRKILPAVREKCPALKKIVQIAGEVDPNNPEVIG